MRRRIFQVVGAGVNLTIAHHIIGNELGEVNRGVGIERNGFVQTDRDVFASHRHCVGLAVSTSLSSFPVLP